MDLKRGMSKSPREIENVNRHGFNAATKTLQGSFPVTRLIPMKNAHPRTAHLLAATLLMLASTSLLAQDWAKTRLEASPRHREYVHLKHGSRTVEAFVVYPEVKSKAPVVILIHEIFGLTDWAKEMADELAGQGFIVVAPDLLSGMGPKGGGSSEFRAWTRPSRLSPDLIRRWCSPISTRPPTTASNCPPAMARSP
jgi:hypothetical protein